MVQEKVTSSFSDEQVLTEHIRTALSMESIKEIAREAYTNDVSVTMPLVKQLAKETGDRFLKAAWLLWKYKVFVPNGEIILNRINGYCVANVSNWYIDACIYKDILEAIRQKNSSYFK